MPKHVLAICHSAGDTQAIVATAKVLAKRETNTTILVVGKTARDQLTKAMESFANEKSWIKMLDIDSLSEEKPITNNLLSISEPKLFDVCSELRKHKYDGLLVGTASYVLADQQSTLAQQILSQLAPNIPSAVFSDYAFYDPLHTLSKERWFKLADKFLVPFKKAIEAFQADIEKSVVVGHPSVDVTKEKYTQWLNEEKSIIEKIHAKLTKINLNPEHEFVFVAGGKAGDEPLIESLCIACQEVPSLKIYVGVHPGAEQAYIDKLQAIIHERLVGEQIKILPKNTIETDEVVYLANGVVSISSTVSTTAAACGKLSAYFQKGKSPTDLSVPYIIDDKINAAFYTENSQLITFLLNTSKASKKLKHEDLAIDKTASELIADEMKHLMKIRQ